VAFTLQTAIEQNWMSTGMYVSPFIYRGVKRGAGPSFQDFPFPFERERGFRPAHRTRLRQAGDRVSLILFGSSFELCYDVLKEIKGRRKKIEKKKKRGVGKVKKNVNTRKQDYIIMTRKLRKYVSELKNQGTISREDFTEIRKRIRNKKFRSKAHLKEYIGGLRK